MMYIAAMYVKLTATSAPNRKHACAPGEEGTNNNACHVV
jgi:hypothetical protein